MIQFSSEKDWSVLGSRDGGLMEEVSLGLTLKNKWFCHIEKEMRERELRGRRCHGGGPEALKRPPSISGNALPCGEPFREAGRGGAALRLGRKQVPEGLRVRLALQATLRAGGTAACD